MAHGTDGELITYDATGAPANVAVGTSGHVLTSGGAGVAPTFQAAAGGGKVLQVVSTTKTDTASSTGNYNYDFISLAITPSATTSKILVLMSIYLNSIDHGTGKVYRNASVLSSFIADTDGGKASGTTGNVENVSNDYNLNHASINILDEPSSTSAQTYSIRAYAQGATVYLNRSVYTANNVNAVRSTSTITLMEIGA
jgi:hypothetical protein